jgi:O-antigen/teichoic acid export membrane protein
MAPRERNRPETREIPPDPDVATVRSRAVKGVFMVSARGFIVRLFGFGGNVVLARLLAPDDFGVVAIGTVFLMAGATMTDGGLGSAVIRSERPAERGDLQTVVAFQLFVSLVIVVLVATVGLSLGGAGTVTALMIASLPVTAFRAGSAVVLERNLNFRVAVLVEIAETTTYYAFAITAAALGAGVWALAGAVIVRSVAGTILMTRASPAGLVTPKLDRERLRSLFSFGARVQAMSVITLVRDQGLNLGIAIVSGVTVLGLWTMAYRILQIPIVMLESLYRISFPGMARLLAAGEEPRPIIERTVAMSSVAAGVFVTAIVGAGPSLVTTLFGERWRETADVLPWSGLSILISMPVSVGVVGYLLAAGAAQIVLRATIFHTLVTLATTFALLRPVGVAAVGIGQLASSLVDVALLGPPAAARTSARLLRAAVVPFLAAAGASAAGRAIASLPLEPPAQAAAGGLTAEIVFLSALFLVRRELIVDMLGLARRALTRERTEAAVTP